MQFRHERRVTAFNAGGTGEMQRGGRGGRGDPRLAQGYTKNRSRLRSKAERRGESGIGCRACKKHTESNHRGKNGGCRSGLRPAHDSILTANAPIDNKQSGIFTCVSGTDLQKRADEGKISLQNPLSAAIIRCNKQSDRSFPDIRRKKI